MMQDSPSPFDMIVDFMRRSRKLEISIEEEFDSDTLKLLNAMKKEFDLDLGNDPISWANWAMKNLGLNEVEKSNLNYIMRVHEIRKNAKKYRDG